MQSTTYRLLLVAGMSFFHVADALAADTDAIRRRLSVVSDSLVGSADQRPELSTEATIEECVAYAMRTNPGLQASFHRWQAAIERVPQVQSLEDPRLSWTYYIQAVETRVGPQRHALSLSQRFPWFGKLKARGDIALAEAESAEQEFEALRLSLIRDITRDYASLYFIDRSIRITEDNLTLVQNWEDVARSRFRTGNGTHADVIKAQVEIGILDDRKRSLEDQASAVLARVNAHLSRPIETPLATQLPDSQDRIIDEQQLLLALRDNNPRLKSLSSNIEARRHAQRLAGKQGYPNFSLGASWIYTDEALNPNTPDSGKDPFMAHVGVTLPIWRGRVAAERRDASARLRAASFQRVDIQQQLEASVKQQAFALRDAQRRVRLYRDSLVPKGHQSLQATATAFQSGRVEFLSIVDALRVLLEFELNLERAQADRVIARSELEMLVGNQLPIAASEETNQ